MRLFDSHAHLTDERFNGEIGAVLDRAAAAGVEAVVTIASDPEDAEAARRLAERPGSATRVWCTAGVHPHVADQCTPDSLRRIEALAAEAPVVAIGETGLDFHYENAPRDVQEDAFRAQLELAARLDRAVVVHSRDADRETARIIDELGEGVRGVLHCFTGSADLMRTALNAGWWVSFSGLITFASYRDEGRVHEVPADRLLAETDSPYLAPVPHRGKRNEPAFVRDVVERISAIREEPVEAVAEAAFRNACDLYGLQN